MRLLQWQLPESLVILYTSDHGQNLLDNGLRLSHGSVENHTQEEGLLPMLVITENETWKDLFFKARNVNFNNTRTLMKIP